MQVNKKNSIRFLWLIACFCMSSISIHAQCNADAGTVTADEATVCLEGSGVDISATAGGDAVVPAGYSLAYLLSSGVEQVILGLQASPAFTVSDVGLYTIHSFVYNPATFDFALIVAGQTTAAEIAALFDPVNGSVECGGISLPGAAIIVQPAAVCLCPADGGSTLIAGTTLTLTTICAGDGVADPIDVSVTGAGGSNFQWVITDENGVILELPTAPPFDLEGAGEGVCLIWNLAYEDGLTGAVVGNNANTDLVGCYGLSNPITVNRNGVNGGEITGMSGMIFNRAVIANRASGTISVINTNDNTIEGTYDMPNNGEPMYVVYNQSNNTVLVGDYNGSVAAFDGETFAPVGSATAGAGVFHMWLSPDNQQLWVNNELDKTISVINPNDLSTITTFPIPSDLLVVGYKPHDVIVSPDNSAAFVTMLGGAGGYVIKYSTTTFTETARAFVGDDPHVSLTGANDKLYVASQGSDELAVLNRSDLSEVTVLNVPNAHGLGMNKAGTYLYVGNIAEGGTAATYTIDLATNTIVGNPVDAPFAAPHNYSVTGNDTQLFLTHSGGANDKVSIYTLSPTPTLVTSLTVGNNPFGLVTYTYGVPFTETTICAGDGVPDPIDVNLGGNYGDNSQWVITDAAGTILALPAAPPFDLEGAGTGVCLIWHLSYEDGLVGAAVGNNATTDLSGCYDLSNPITVTREDCGGCGDENTLCFDDAGIDWTMNALSGTFTVGTQTFDVSIDDADYILLETVESGDALEVRIDPYDNNDVVNITYALSEVADNVVFPIVDLDKKDSGSIQQEQVCVYGYLGSSPIPIQPVITSLDGSVDINGNCATATTDSAISGEDESVLVTFDQCIDRVVIEYGSGPMAPNYPTESKIEIGAGGCFLTQVCGPCDDDCTENTLDFTDAGVDWNSGALGDSYQVGLQNYNIAISDADNILVDTEEENAGLMVGIEPNSSNDEVTVCYNLSEISNNVFFKIRDLDKKESASMQQEQVCVYGLLGDSPVQIMPDITSYDGSVAVNGNCATATTNSATSGDEESVLVNFSDCIDKIVIVYGSGPMAPADPSYSKIYIGDEFGVVTGECGTGCENDCVSQNTLDFTNSGIDWTDEALAGTYTVETQTYDISITDSDNILETEVESFSTESGEGLQIGINPDDTDDVVTICYDLSEVSNDVAFLIEDLDKKLYGAGASNQQEEVCVYGSLGGTAVTPILTSYDGSVSISGNCATGTEDSGYSGDEESVLVRFDECIDQICIDYTSGSMAPADPTYSKIIIGAEFGFYTGVCGDGCDTCDPGDPGSLTPAFSQLCIESGGSSPATITAITDVAAVIPTGYSLVYLLTESGIILGTNTASTFDVTDAGTYTIHGFVYDPVTFDLATISFGNTTAAELNAMLTQGGGDVCASLDLTGATTAVADPSAGSLLPDANAGCIDTGGTITISATHSATPNVPDSYVTLYLLTTPPLANPLIVQTSSSPSFDVTEIGDYTIQTLVYDPASGLDVNNGGLLDIYLQLIDGGGAVCAKLDLGGAPFTIENCCDSGDPGSLTPVSESLCVEPGASSPSIVEAIPDGNAVIPAGYSVVYLLTENGTIIGLNTTDPRFEVSDAGEYTIHTFVYNPATFNLSMIAVGTTTAAGLNGMLTQGGGNVCASLDLVGATTVIADPNAGSLTPDSNIPCIDGSNTITISATHAGENPVVPNGYTALYLLVTPPLAAPPIIQTSSSPSFDVTEIDAYTIHTLVYNPNSALDVNVGTLLDIYLQTIDAGGAVCAKLDIAGALLPVPACLDNDKDGIPDNIDLDDDNDGITDVVEGGGVDPSADADNDGVPNYEDADYLGFTDINGDGINDRFDADGDGVPDIFDLDSDNDGSTDLFEAGGMDADGNGLVDNFTDNDNDGWTDIYDNSEGGTALANPDSDNDGVVDAFDLDSDNDGITDLFESGGADTDSDGVVDNLNDADMDGLADIIDPDDNDQAGGNDGPGTPLTNPDSDNDGNPDRFDLDSDNDGIADIVEAGGIDTNGDGQADNIADADNNGYVNIFDAADGGTPLSIADTDNDGVADQLDLDSDNDGIADISEVGGGMDADGDGTIDNYTDIDGDGLADSVDEDNNNTPSPGDGFGTAYTILDTDKDGYPDNQDLDKDNDGIADLVEAGGEDADGNGVIDSLTDADNDGYADVVDNDDNTTPGAGDGTGIPLDNPDSDRDGIADAADLDSDNDGLPDLTEAGGIDGDGDGAIDNAVDADGDGYADIVDNDDNTTPGAGDGPGTPLPVVDTDRDNVADYLDLDSDNDGVGDLTEAGGTDANRDGVLDSTADSDNDGLGDIVDPNDNDTPGAGDGPGTPLTRPDSDGDTYPDQVDLDSDNDGITDIAEAGGSDIDGDGMIDNFVDNDGDGYAELVDTDDNTTTMANDGPGTALADNDTDGDGNNDRIDLDSDNDELPDIAEVGLADSNGDGVIDSVQDTDGDGYVDAVDPTDGGTPAPMQDADGDMVPDRIDLDSDNDGVADIIEAGGRDMNADGLTDSSNDVDGDGLFDSIDPDNNLNPGGNDGIGIPLYMFINNAYGSMPDKDGDGVANHIDLDSDNDGLSDLAESFGNMDMYMLIDVDYNGILDGTDGDNDGIIDGDYDNGSGHGGTSMIMPLDSDTDLIFDFIDIDSDNDGITDLTEGQLTIGFVAPLANNVDIDGDGINDAFDMNVGDFGGFMFLAIDTDEDNTPDYLDLNSDNDAEPDSVEGSDFIGDGNSGLAAMGIDSDNDGLDDAYDSDTSVADPTNGGFFAMDHPDADGGETERDWRDPLTCVSVKMSVLLEGALVDPADPGTSYFNTMRPNLNVDRQRLPGQIPVNPLITPTPAGQPYSIGPWNYTGDEGFDWTGGEYAAFGLEYGQEVVDWILISFRTSTLVEDEIAKTAGLVLEDGTVVFVEECYLPANGENALYIVAEHRSHMGAMSPQAVPVIGGKLIYDFRTADSYVGPNPAQPVGAGQKEVLPGLFALYGADSEQQADADVLNNPSYNITGDDKLLWDIDSGTFDIYNPNDFDMDGDVNGFDKIIHTINFGTFSAVPR